MATTNDFYNGMNIIFNNEIYTIIEFLHVKPGKGSAFVRTKLKHLKTGRVIENTFDAGVKIDVANVERRPYIFLYSDEEYFHFMHQETYEQVMIPKSLIQEPLLLKENQQVYIAFDADTDTPITCDLPPYVELKVVYTEPGVKGDTAASTPMKNARLETGLEIKVPLFIETGDIIKVDTRELKYAERVKK
ncbi:MAG: elongation factor P [Bacteroidales bacterium]|nr:elongation factor P [Bacteroidales bacterium]